MNIKIVQLLSAICAALIVIIIVEWIVAKSAQNRLLASIKSSTSEKYQIEVPVIDLKAQTEENYADMVSRPLFIRGRRPVNEPSPEQANALPGSDRFDWQLNGIYTGKKGLSAFFSREKIPVAKDNYRKLIANEELDDWKLTEIHKDRVILTQGSELKELLLRKPKLKELPQNQNQNQNQNQKRAPKKNIGQIQDEAQRRRNRNRNRMPQPPEPEPQSQSQSDEDAPENSDNE